VLRYLVRSIPVFLRGALARERTLVSRLTRRVGPGDLDVNVHMNQAVYAQVMELSRADLALRSGAWRAWRKAAVWPVVAEQHLTYRRELRLGQRYALDSRAVAMDGRLLVIDTWLLVGDAVHARNVTKLIFTKAPGPDGARVCTPAEALAVNAPFLAPPLPVRDWRVVGEPR
jgi:acyl-CoA thioesterase FadM